jgi:hypothetical protein
MQTVRLTLDVDASQLEAAKSAIAGIKGVRIYKEVPTLLQKEITGAIAELEDVLAGRAEAQDARTMIAALRKELGHEVQD